MQRVRLLFSLLLIGAFSARAEGPINIGGIYPHLTMRNNQGECGTGAVVPWQGSLWAITYGPHRPQGSDDKLYEITPALEQKIFKGSVGGTPADRMIHRESNQLLIGPYLIDAQKNIRVIPPSVMYGRLTGMARHLTDPASKVYYATMEQGLYEVDVNTLAVKCLIRDRNKGAPAVGLVTKIEGAHGKGLYSGQGRLIFSNNGELSNAAMKDPTAVAGALAQWFGQDDWQLVRRNQFTEITGPGGIYGSSNPDKDPVWAMGWDARSVILALLENGEWSYYRLPKGSHSYDGAHGWNTEWPRIREIGETNLLATMHGTFWRFPANFSKEHSAGIAPRSNYLKVIGDFCRWNDRIVFGCDDSAEKEFLNKRDFKAAKGGPLLSNSNLWFVDPAQIDHIGPVIGRGSVWLRDNVAAGALSDAYLFDGYDYRQLHLKHTSATPVVFTLEVDKLGNNQWTALKTVTVPANGALSLLFAEKEKGAWVRLKTDVAATGVTALFQYRNRDLRSTANAALFDGLATAQKPAQVSGVMRSLGYNKFGVAAMDAQGNPAGYYEMNQEMKLVPGSKTNDYENVLTGAKVTGAGFEEDEASFSITEDGQKWRLPKSAGAARVSGARLCREVATERDLLNLGGTFYEVPARNAQGMAKMRPVATHNLAINDFCSHNGMILFSGIAADAKNERIFRSEDGKAAVWAGVIEELWQLGKPRGVGGPWKNSAVTANKPSDPYLMTAYDKKSVELTASTDAVIKLEVDVDGTGLWIPYQSFSLKAGKAVTHSFPEGFSAYWVRAVSDTATTASVTFTYE
ncbi:MAG TPA: hypothetical protein PKI68_03695 [Pontiellaceae bacterium]|nr:hypothetical protein [Pontiellaceae bacterium]